MKVGNTIIIIGRKQAPLLALVMALIPIMIAELSEYQNQRRA
jgi:hypothetical protein